MNARVLTLAAPLLLLAACSTQPTDTPASGAQPSASAPAQPAVGAAPGTAVPGAAMKDDKVAQRSVYYDFDKSDIKPEQRPTVEENAKYLRGHPELKVRVEGNADERGSREYNLALGQRRAEGVMKTMSLLGVASSRMESVSYGKEKPRATGHDETSWRENRRSDIVYP